MKNSSYKIWTTLFQYFELYPRKIFFNSIAGVFSWNRSKGLTKSRFYFYCDEMWPKSDKCFLFSFLIPNLFYYLKINIGKFDMVPKVGNMYFTYIFSAEIAADKVWSRGTLKRSHSCPDSSYTDAIHVNILTAIFYTTGSISYWKFMELFYGHLLLPDS
jgi:hypothetical protein